MIIKVKVKPASKKQEIIKTDEGYVVSVKGKAEKNKANIELLKALNKHFGKDVRIIKGFKSKNKIVEVVEKNEGILFKGD